MPDGLHPRTQIAIPLKIFDWHGDDIQVDVHQQLGMGDKYTGSEYVTAQELEQLSLEEDELLVRARFPGNYRVLVRATDKHGTTEYELDLPVTWAPGNNPFEVRGVAIDIWGQPDWLNLDLVRARVDYAKSLNANFIELVPYWWMESVNDSKLVPCDSVPHCVIPSDQLIRDWIQHAKSKGMGVVLAPHFFVGKYEAESWAVQPTNLAAWFESYTGFITRYAEIAAEEEVEILVVGKNLCGTDHAHASWSNVVDAIKNVYQGQLAYVNPSIYTNNPIVSGVWPSMDIIGVAYYWPGSAADTQPTVEQMQANIERGQTGQAAAMHRTYGLPLIAFEMGTQNIDGCNYNPWILDNRIQDNQEPIDYLEAGLRAGTSLPGFKGFFMWSLQPKRRLYPIDGMFYQKPVTKALALWNAN